MQIVLAFLIGGLYTVAIYLMLRQTIARVILGLALLTNATNLLIFTVGGLTRARPPIVPDGLSQPSGPFADPVPQSLILTAIVIGFGVLAFMMVLAFRTNQIVSVDNTDTMQATDALVPAEKSALAEAYDEELESHPDRQTDVVAEERLP
ncbi:MAG: hypothetical protein RLZZ387_4156 [Chloroflexota bacterium]|jgi:multicomponent Na+:H+ antiporter subunit C